MTSTTATSPEGEEPRWINSQRELLRALEVKSMKELGERLQDWCDLDLMLDDVNKSNFTVVVDMRGTTFVYPFRLNELSETVADLEVEGRARRGRDWLADGVRDVEGFAVQFIDWDPESWARYAYEDLNYPYKRRASGDNTVGDWINKRIADHFPAFDTEVLLPDKTVAGPRKKLKTVRAAWLAAAKGR